jgi:hypothetical protein
MSIHQESQRMSASAFYPTLAAAAVAALALSCNPQESTQPTGDMSDVSARSAPPLATAHAASVRSGLPEFDPDDFVRGVDNPLFPLPLGRRLIYHGSEDGEREVIITEVTREHKTILGVPVVVVLDRVFADGELAEKTFDWYAQDKHGNVWYFGEDTKEYEDGKVVSTAGSFEAGKNGARAGVIMRAHPKVGLTTPQESAPGVAEDRARVVDKNVTVTVPAGTFRHCIRSAEFTPLEPNLLENKWYCPGVGITRERDLRGGTGRTALVRIEPR